MTVTFYPHRTQREVGAAGKPTSKLAIIGEALGAQEEKTGIPFTGHAGGVLDQCLHSAQLIRSDIYITNVLKIKPLGNKIALYYEESDRGVGRFTAAGMVWVEQLWKELEHVKANVLVPLGKPATLAVTGTDKVGQYRGYVMEGRAEVHGRKVIPTYHPAATLYGGKYIWRYYISNDLSKAKRESAYPDIRRPVRELLWPDSFENALDWLEFFASCDRLSIDIEVINFEVSCISLSDNPARSMAFPMYHSPEPQWTVQEEAVIWKWFAKILGDEEIYKVFQNGIFDVHFLMTRCGVHVRPITPEMFEDTMIAHSIMFPEMLKGLAFLGSLYCGSQQYWKNMVRFQNIKENS